MGYAYDAFFAYHGTFDENGSYNAAIKVKEKLSEKYNIYLFEEENDESWVEAIDKIRQSKCMLVFINDTVPVEDDGRIRENRADGTRQQLYSELETFYGYVEDGKKSITSINYVYVGEKTKNEAIAFMTDLWREKIRKCNSFLFLKDSDGIESIDKWMGITHDKKAKPFGQINYERIVSQLNDFCLIIDEKKICLDFKKNEPDFYAYERIKKEYSPNIPAEIYCLPTSYINGVNYIKGKKTGAGKGFKDYAKLCDLDKKYGYCYWPVELDPSVNPDADNISICAICFGTMLLRSWIKSDRGIYLKYNDDLDENLKTDKHLKTIFGAINLLITLRDYEKFGWMNNISFKEGSVPCTINQTTLAISTLLSCYFLGVSDTKNSDIANELLDINYYSSDFSKVFMNRFYYINQSIDWIYNKSGGSDSYCYFYGNESKKLDSVSLTVFVFETTLKYVKSLLYALKKDAEKKIDHDIILDCVRLSCSKLKSLIAYFNRKGKYGSCTITNECRILKALCEFCLSKDDYSSYIDQSIFDKALIEIKYIYSMVKDYNIDKFKEDELEIYEYFNYINETKTEKYENCSEFIYLDSMIKYEMLLGKNDDQIKKINEDFFWINENMINEQPFVYACGHNEKLKNPIFALYYYRMVVFDFLELMKSEDESEKNN